MIRRRGRGEFLLITQDDHARLAGKLAEHFGNAHFQRADPFEPTVLATAMHDSGWPLHDQSPTLNKQNLPIDVFESTANIAVKVWSASAERAAELNDYAGLLVSLHVMSLSLLNESKDQHDRFAINKFQHQEIERQEVLRRRIGLRVDLPLKFGLAMSGIDPSEDQLSFNLKLLQAMDLLSLAICCTQLPTMLTRDLPPRPGAAPIQFSLQRPDDLTLSVDPWPFDVEHFRFDLPLRRVSDQPFASESEFREKLRAAMVEAMAVQIRPA